jgi:hypothetical protein
MGTCFRAVTTRRNWRRPNDHCFKRSETDHVDLNHRCRDGVADHEGWSMSSELQFGRQLLRAAT